MLWSSHLRRSFPQGTLLLSVMLAGCLVVAVPAGTGAGSSAATAAEPSSSRLVEVASVAPGASQLVGGPVIDSVAGRAYVIDRGHNSVEIYDVTGDGFESSGSITTGFDTPVALALDEAVHRLYVADDTTDQLHVVDIGAGSSTAGTVLSSIPTGGRGPIAVVAQDANTVLVANDVSEDISVIDIPSGSHASAPIPGGPADIAVDPASGRVVVAGTTRSQLTTISGTAVSGVTTASVTTDRAPRELAWNDGTLLAVTESSSGAPVFRLESADPVTGALTDSSPDLPGQPNDLAVDATSGTAFLAYAAFGRAGIQSLDARTHAPRATAATGRLYGQIAVDPARHRVFATETFTVGGARVTMFESPAVTRVGGVDRYAVSAAISARSHDPGVGIAYIASGEQFADALTGSAPAGVQGAPVLLVTRSAIPDPVAAELTRLVPRTIVVLGGASSIDESVVQKLGDYSHNVTRIAGADRYSGSVAVSRAMYGDTLPVVFLASGESFPDALAGAAAGGHLGGPVLLTRAGSITDEVLTELRRLAPARIVVLGGPQTVSQPVLDAVAGIAPVGRQAGNDRYETSVVVSAATYPVPPRTVYLASGAVFPDALSASAAAGLAGAPVLLLSPAGVPDQVAVELRRIRPLRIVVLGGPATVSDATVSALDQFLAE